MPGTVRKASQLTAVLNAHVDPTSVCFTGEETEAEGR